MTYRNPINFAEQIEVIVLWGLQWAISGLQSQSRHILFRIPKNDFGGLPRNLSEK